MTVTVPSALLGFAQVQNAAPNTLLITGLASTDNYIVDRIEFTPLFIQATAAGFSATMSVIIGATGGVLFRYDMVASSNALVLFPPNSIVVPINVTCPRTSPLQLFLNNPNVNVLNSSVNINVYGNKYV